MSDRETSLWKWLAKARLSYKDNLVMDRVENKVSAGTLDVLGCCVGHMFIMELKCATADSHGYINVRFEPAQIETIRDFTKAGACCVVLINISEGTKSTKVLVPGRDILLILTKVKADMLIKKYKVFSPDNVLRTIVQIDKYLTRWG